MGSWWQPACLSLEDSVPKVIGMINFFEDPQALRSIVEQHQCVVAGTGHRFEKLSSLGKGIYRQPQVLDQCQANLDRLAGHFLEKFGADLAITGGALAWDMAVGRGAQAAGIPYIVVVPFLGQESRWAAPQQRMYRELLEQAQQVVVVSPGGFDAQKMKRRNRVMVDHAHRMLALWDGTAGGTGHCVNYALTQRVRVSNVWRAYRERFWR